MKREMKLAFAILFPIVAGLAVGCTEAEEGDDLTVEESEPGTQTFPLLSIEVDQSRTVEIYEPMPGQFLIGSKGPIGSTMDTDDYDLTGRIEDIYKRLVPNRAIPSVVVDAQQRQDDYLAKVPALETLPISIEESSSASPAAAELDVDDEISSVIPKDPYHSWWTGTVCQSTSGLYFPDYISNTNCAIHRTGGGTWHYSAMMEVVPGCLAYDGNINCRVRWKQPGASSSTYQTIWDVQVSEGWYNTMHLWATPLASTLDWEFKIYNATNDSYHREFITAYNMCPDDCMPLVTEVCSCLW